MAPPVADMLDLLACPVCREPLRLFGESIACAACARLYPVRDGIPILVAGESTVGEAASHTGTVGQDT